MNETISNRKGGFEAKLMVLGIIAVVFTALSYGYFYAAQTPTNHDSIAPHNTTN